MDTKRPISEPEPKRDPKITRVLFQSGTSFEDIADALNKLRDENRAKRGLPPNYTVKEPPKPQE